MQDNWIIPIDSVHIARKPGPTTGGFTLEGFGENEDITVSIHLKVNTASQAQSLMKQVLAGEILVERLSRE